MLKCKYWSWFTALFWAATILLVAPVRFLSGTISQILKYSGSFILLFVFLRVLVYLVERYQPPPVTPVERRHQRLIFALSTLFCLMIWLGYGVIFYPGLISWDFYIQWFEMTGKIPFADWHPVFHTLCMWLVTRIWYSPAMISLVQIITLSLVVGMVARRLFTLNSPLWIVLMLVGFYGLFPLNGFYVVSLWKDIGYSIAFLWLVVLTLDVVSSKGRVLGGTGFRIAFLTALCCVAMMRHNGIVPAFGTILIFLAVYHRRYLKPLLLLLISLTALILIYRGPVMDQLKVDKRSKNILKAHLPIQHIGAFLNVSNSLTREDKEFLNHIIPVSYWKRAYNPCSCMPLIFGKNPKGGHYLDGEFLKRDENYQRLLKIWAGEAIRHPLAIAGYHLKGSELLWRVHIPYKPFVIPDEDLVEEDLYSGYKPSPRLLERVGPTGRFLIHLINNLPTGWFLHRGALYFWIGLFSVNLIILRTRKPVILIVAAPMLLQALTVAAFPLVQNTRFMFPIILTAPLFVGLIFSSTLEDQFLVDG